MPVKKPGVMLFLWQVECDSAGLVPGQDAADDLDPDRLSEDRLPHCLVVAGAAVAVGGGEFLACGYSITHARAVAVHRPTQGRICFLQVGLQAAALGDLGDEDGLALPPASQPPAAIYQLINLPLWKLEVIGQKTDETLLKLLQHAVYILVPGIRFSQR